ncbi:hypothetical protein [Streptomyces sp. NRRL F-5123]|uniref:hypothetical protein n=1 Tax=Streptomyces sp. NRRL F-5123 TaxID=1463856 RepID=UPI0004E22A99|nr:hypothetical protein [Streptomyces sp. NRRL F-5123]
MSESIDERFNRWAEKLRAILVNPDEDARQEEFETAVNDMWIEDKRLIAYWDNCIDGCCPTGELILVRLVHDQLSAPAIVRTFPEFIRSTRTHRAVIMTED